MQLLCCVVLGGGMPLPGWLFDRDRTLHRLQTAAERIAELEAGVEELRQCNEELRQALQQAQAEIKELRTKLGMNSRNSSLPPILATAGGIDRSG